MAIKSGIVTSYVPAAVVRKYGGSISKYILEQTNKVWKLSVQEMITTMSQLIVVDTGMSMASLMGLAEKVRMKGTIQSFLTNKQRTGHKGLTGRWGDNNAEYKSASLGTNLGRKQPKAFVYELGTKSKPKWRIRFSITVFQHFLHEQGLGVNGAGGGDYKYYDSVQQGIDRFQEVFDNEIDKHVRGQDILDLVMAPISRVK